MSTAATLRPDIARAASRMSATFGGKGEICQLVEHLVKVETVEMLAVGWYGKGNGLLALTNHRLLFVLHGWVHQQLDEFPLDTISSVQWSARVITGTLIVEAGGNQVEISQMPIPDGRPLSDRLRERISMTVVLTAVDDSSPFELAASTSSDRPCSVCTCSDSRWLTCTHSQCACVPTTRTAELKIKFYEGDRTVPFELRPV